MKKFILLVLTVFMTVSLFAQNAKSTGLTDKDVQNFAKHFSAISAEMERTFGDAENQNYVQKKSDYVKAEKILNKYGFTGSNVVEKYAMMSSCIGIINLEKSGMAAMFGKGAMAAQMKYINQDDYDVVERNWDVLTKAINVDGINEEVDEEIAEERRRDEEEEAEYQAQVNAMMADIMGMFNPEKMKQQAAKETAANEANKAAAIKEYKTYAKKLASGKKDAGMLYKKYDSKNASKWKLSTKYKATDFMPDDGLYFTKSFDSENYFRFGTQGISIIVDGEWENDTTLASDSWEIYSNEKGGYEVVFHTKKGIIHFYWNDWNDEKAYLENDSVKIEGEGHYSAG